MSLTSWLTKVKKSAGEYEKPQLPGMPDPNSQPTEEQAKSCEAANSEIYRTVTAPTPTAKKEEELPREAKAKMVCPRLPGISQRNLATM